MRRKYMIGFFSVLILFTMLMSAGYQISYRHMVDRQAAREEEEPPVTESITATTGEASSAEDEPEEGYLIRELNGYAAVYLADGTTLFELTDIPVIELPEELQRQVMEGLRIENEEQLYGMLENYSS